MEREYVKAKDVKSIATIPCDRPTFLHTDGGPVRILGFLVCCGEVFEDYHFDAFATFPIGDDGIVYTNHDGNSGTPGIFYGPIKKGDYDYKQGFGAMFVENNNITEAYYLEYCKEIGLEITEN